MTYINRGNPTDLYLTKEFLDSVIFAHIAGVTVALISAMPGRPFMEVYITPYVRHIDQLVPDDTVLNDLLRKITERDRLDDGITLYWVGVEIIDPFLRRLDEVSIKLGT